MAPIISRDKVKVRHRSRVKGRFDGLQSRVTDGRWRESFFEIGIIGTRSSQMGSSEVPFEGFSQTINHRWIGTKGHPPFQTVMEDSRNKGFFPRKGGLLLDNGSQDEYFVFVKPQFLSPLGEGFRPVISEIIHHDLYDLFWILLRGEFIGVGE